MARSARIFWLVLLLVSLSFLITSPRLNRWAGSRGSTASSSAAGSLEREREEKRLVVASEKADDTTWLQRRLPDWPVSRYIVDDHDANLTVPIKKGREAMVYLT
jgi:cytochrome c biogenesis protein ResB